LNEYGGAGHRFNSEAGSSKSRKVRGPFGKLTSFARRRGKWIVAQCVLLLVNYVQNEMVSLL
jgi:hypothetical protein